MPTQDIPRSEWRKFFDTFSRQHEAWLTTVEVVGADIGAQLEGNELPLQGISADTKGSDPDAILITLGSRPDQEITHIVHHATRVRFEQDGSGAHEGLDIEAADGVETILRFRAARLPEQLNGIVGQAHGLS